MSVGPAVAQIELRSAQLLQPDRRDDALRILVDLQFQARAEFEKLRLLLESKTTQEAAWKTVRLAYVLRQGAERGLHPRSGGPDSSWARVQKELEALLLGVRRELGVPKPEDLFMEPVDWQVSLGSDPGQPPAR